MIGQFPIILSSYLLKINIGVGTAQYGHPCLGPESNANYIRAGSSNKHQTKLHKDLSLSFPHKGLQNSSSLYNM